MSNKYRYLIFTACLVLLVLSCQAVQRLVNGTPLTGPAATAEQTPWPTTPPPFVIPTEPEATQAPPPESGTPEPGLLFIDEFNDPTSGWPEQSTGTVETGYFQDGYHIALNAERSVAWSIVGPHYANVRINVDATLIAGEEDNYLGLVCRFQDADNFYAGVISSDGYFVILRRFEGGALDYIAPDHFEQSIVINQHMAMNLIELSCVGNQITLIVNGQQLAQAEDDSIATGDVGLLVGTISATSTDVLFDNFTLYLEDAPE